MRSRLCQGCSPLAVAASVGPSAKRVTHPSRVGVPLLWRHSDKNKIWVGHAHKLDWAPPSCEPASWWGARPQGRGSSDSARCGARPGRGLPSRSRRPRPRQTAQPTHPHPLQGVWGGGRAGLGGHSNDGKKAGPTGRSQWGVRASADAGPLTKRAWWTQG